jgi:hypothetical protein
MWLNHNYQHNTMDNNPSSNVSKPHPQEMHVVHGQVSSKVVDCQKTQ